MLYENLFRLESGRVGKTLGRSKANRIELGK